MNAKPLVSILIDNYNYGEYLGECIESALAQTYAPVEIIVVDDGSSDGSRAVIESFGSRLRAIFQENGGQASAFNTAFAASRGELLCFLDADDLWLPGKVERIVQVLQRHPSAGWLRHRLTVIDQAGQPRGDIALPSFRRTRTTIPAPLLVIEGRFPVLTSGLVLRRSVAGHVFPIPRELPFGPDGPPVSLRFDADAYMAFKAAATGAALLSLDESLALYRRHERQQYVGPGGLKPMVERQIVIAGAVATVFDQALGRHVTPSSVYKHRAICAALEGRPIWARQRVAPLLSGLRRSGALLAASPRTALRQTGALLFAFLAPALWSRKLLYTTGFSGALAGLIAGASPGRASR